MRIAKGKTQVSHLEIQPKAHRSKHHLGEGGYETIVSTEGLLDHYLFLSLTIRQTPYGNHGGC